MKWPGNNILVRLHIVVFHVVPREIFFFGLLDLTQMYFRCSKIHYSHQYVHSSRNGGRIGEL